MPRMSPMDRAFFLLETEQRPMNVGVLVVLQGRRTARGRPGDDLVRRMLRCPVGPPFNQRLAENVVAGWPVLVALSRKFFIGETLDLPADETVDRRGRDPELDLSASG